MIDHFVNHIVEVAFSIIIGIFIINMACEAFLDFNPLDLLKSLLSKITNYKDKEKQ